MRKTLSSAVATTSLSLALAVAGATAVTFSGTDTAFAKSENANGGNRGGNGKGNGNGNGNRGGETKAGGERGGAERGGGKPATAQGKSAERGNGGSGHKGGNGAGASSRSGGGGKLFGFLPRHEPRNGRGGGNGGGATASAQRAAPATSVRPAPRLAEDEDEGRYGNSWKTRLDDGILRTHPSELGAWNSAKRSPQAIANMAEKYERTGEMSGAGGMIGYLVSSYWALDGEDGARTTYFTTLQDAVHEGELSVEAAARLFEGPPLSPEDFKALLESGDYDDIDVTDGVVDCKQGVTCEDADIEFLQAELDALTFLSENDGADGGYYDALEAAAEADGIVVPNRSPDNEEIRQTMLEDVKDLLDIDQNDYVFEEPEAEEEEVVTDEET